MPPISGILLAARRLKKKKREKRSSGGGESGNHEAYDDDNDDNDDNDDDEQAGDADNDAPPVVRLPAYEPQKRARTKTRCVNMEDVAKAAIEKNIRVELPPFPVSTVKTFEEFDRVLAQYASETNALQVIRSSNSRTAWNKKLKAAYEEKKAAHKEKKAADEENKSNAETEEKKFKDQLHLLPPALTYFKREFRCVHGDYQPSKRGLGDTTKPKRYHATTLYTGCPSRITAVARRNEVTDKWLVHVHNENAIHNHPCNESVFNAYSNDSFIEDEDLFQLVAAQVEVDGNAHQIRDHIARHDGPFSRSRFNNLKSYRLGGLKASDGLEDIMEQLHETEGGFCLFLHDQEKTITGILFQTGIQREFAKRFGDSLILDWTHNTNNLGFHLGSLMATSITGKGVTVFNFLCLSQNVATMTRVLSAYKEENPAVDHLLESVVIDKDYKEWKAVNLELEKAAVVLCQFHVVKWFKTVVSDSRYKIAKDVRESVRSLVKTMVYAESEGSFAEARDKLEDLLDGEEHATFHEYMRSRWYNIKQMWSNFRRGKIFTAGNPTSNRLESHWNQLKSGLGKKKRIDKCVESVLMRESSIIQREYDELLLATTKTAILPGEHTFMRPVLRDLCRTRAALVKMQWVKCLARTKRYSCEGAATSRAAKMHRDGAHGGPSDHTLAVVCKNGLEFEVTAPPTAPWSCSCRFGSSHRLPCRHQLFVAKEIFSCDVFPVTAVHSRWRVSLHGDLIELLRVAGDELCGVRLTTRRSGKSSRFAVRVSLRRPKQTIKIIQVPRPEEDSRVVLDAIEKRNIVEGQCAKVMTALMRLGSVAFWEASGQLEDVLVGYLGRLHISTTPAAAAATTSTPAAAAATTPTPGGRSSAAAETTTATSQGQQCPVACDVAGEKEVKNNDEEMVCGDNDTNRGDDDDDLDDDEDDGCDERVDCTGFCLDDDSCAEVDEEDEAEEPRPLTSLSASLFDGLDLGAMFDSQVSSLHLSQVEGASQDANLYSEAADLLLYSPPISQGEVRFPSQPEVPCSPVAPHTPSRNTRSQNKNVVVGDAVTYSAQASSKRKSEGDHSPPPVKRIQSGLFSGFTLPRADSGVTRNAKQQAGAQTRVSISVPRHRCVVSVIDFVQGVLHTPLCDVGELLSRYPCAYDEYGIETRVITVVESVPSPTYSTPTFVVTTDAAQALVAAIVTKREADGRPRDLTALFETGVAQYIASFTDADGGVVSFTEETICGFTKFHEMRTHHRMYMRDASWLKLKKTWATLLKSPMPLEFLCEQNEEGVDSVNAVGRMLASTSECLDSLTLATTVLSSASKSECAMAPAMELLGRVNNDMWLNDSVIHMALCAMAANCEDVTVMDPLRRPCLPRRRLDQQRLVIFPVNARNKHWCGIYVVLEWQAGHNAFVYDPQCKPHVWGVALEEAWADWAKPALDSWFERDVRAGQVVQDLTDTAPQLPTLGHIHREFILMPKQTDSSNCGVYVLGAAYCYVHETYGIQDLETISTTRIKLMRLRILNLLVCASRTVDGMSVSAGADAVKRFGSYGLLSNTPAGQSRRVKKKT